MTAYYNENDEFAASWLRELIRSGQIAPGHVDTRSIKEVQPDDLAGYSQHHFFAGIGVWSHALRLAGWPDDRPVWTGSCPCQPFSAAGKRGGFADDRHLWPAWMSLVRECRPTTVIGEQVEGAVRHWWLDLVFGDLEDQGYACGAAVLGAHSVGAPHIRQRLYWVADATRDGRREERADGSGRDLGDRAEGLPAGLGAGDADSGLAQSEGEQHDGGWNAGRGRREFTDGGDARHTHAPSSFWRNPDWLYCRDAKWRPVESGAFPLVDGAPARVGRLRGYGNAICAPQAEAFIQAVM